MKKLCNERKKGKWQQPHNSNCAIVTSPVGDLKVFQSAKAISGILFSALSAQGDSQQIKIKNFMFCRYESDVFVASDSLGANSTITSEEISLYRRFCSELSRYFSHPQKHSKINVPIKLCGTEMQKKIWERIAKIPIGTTVTYGALAKELMTSPRVIGNACRRNPLPLIIPCHRVVASKGMGGFCGKNDGHLLMIKLALLEREKATAKTTV